jgi:hypothetical protein
VVPQEYGMTRDEKAVIGSKVSKNLLIKIREDIQVACAIKPKVGTGSTSQPSEKSRKKEDQGDGQGSRDSNIDVEHQVSYITCVSAALVCE